MTSSASLFSTPVLQIFSNKINRIKTIHWGKVVSNVDIFTDIPYITDKINL